MLQAAENVVLPNDGEQLVLTCGTDQEALRTQLDKWPPSTVSRTGDRYTIELITIAEDDFRTPLQRITCPTCVGCIAESRTKRRRDAFGKHEGPRAIAAHSRLVAQAYTRSAEVEEALANRLSPETPPT